jgi:hypothetical protein
MKNTPLTVIVILLAALLGAAITWAIVHKHLIVNDNLDDAFYAYIVKEPHTVPSVKDFKQALESVQTNSSQDINVSYCFQLEGEEKPLEYGPQDPPCENQPNMATLTHKIYSVNPSDIVTVVSTIGAKMTTTPTPTPTPTP